MSTIFETAYAGHPIRYELTYPAARYQFHPPLRPSEASAPDVRLSRELLAAGRALLPPGSSDGYVEFRCLIEPTARSLLRFGCTLFHAVAFVLCGRAILLTAPSGVGKTTQFLNWQRLHPGETAVINGDKPLLECRSDGQIVVHTSPWRGKEQFTGACTAPLGGVVLLARGDENRIASLSAREAAAPLMMQFLACPETEAEIRALTAILDQMLRTCPVLQLTNRGDDASTELLRDALNRRLK